MSTSSLGFLVYSYPPKIWVEDEMFIPESQREGDAGADLKADLSKEEDTWFADSMCMKGVSSGKGRVYINGKEIKGKDIESVKEELLALGISISADAVLLAPGELKIIPAGFHIQMPLLPDPWVAQYKVVGRSGLAGAKRLCISNSPGIIDSGYTGPVLMAVENRSEDWHVITHGARIAQGLYEIAVDQRKVGFNRVDSLDEFSKTTRGSGGFGSTSG